MSRNFVAAGLAGSLLVVPHLEARAQGTAVSQSTPPASCSNFLCTLFKGPAEQPRPVASQPRPVPEATRDLQPGAAAGTSTPGVAAAARSVAPASIRREERHAANKPRHRIHTVTIAVGKNELGQLRTLAAVLRNEPVRLIADHDRHAASADLSVDAKIDANQSGERVRLFVEQLHIVGGASIASVADLDDKVVSFGPDGSTSQAVARKAFAALGVGVKETPLEVDNALDGVATGDIAAVVLLAPQPVERLKRVTGLHLVAWPDDGKLPAGAVASKIDTKLYPGLGSSKTGATIRAVGVDAMLRPTSKGARQAATRAFMASLARHASTLAQRGFARLKIETDTRTARR